MSMMSEDSANSRASFWFYNKLIRDDLEGFVKKRGEDFVHPTAGFYNLILARILPSDLNSDIDEEPWGIRELWHFIIHTRKMKNISASDGGKTMKSAVKHLDKALRSEFGKERSHGVTIKKKMRDVRGQTIVLGILTVTERRNEDAKILFERYKNYLSPFDRQSLRCYLTRSTNDREFIRQNSYSKFLEKVVELIKMVLAVAEDTFITKISKNICANSREEERQSLSSEDDDVNGITDSEHHEDTQEEEDLGEREEEILISDSDSSEINENNSPVVLEPSPTRSRKKSISKKKKKERDSFGSISPSTMSNFTSVTKTTVGGPRHNNFFSYLQDANIILGVKTFGCGKWKEIIDNFSFPDYRNNISIKDRFRTLHENKHVDFEEGELVIRTRQYRSLVAYVEKQREKEKEEISNSNDMRRTFYRERRFSSPFLSKSNSEYKRKSSLHHPDIADTDENPEIDDLQQLRLKKFRHFQNRMDSSSDLEISDLETSVRKKTDKRQSGRNKTPGNEEKQQPPGQKLFTRKKNLYRRKKMSFSSDSEDVVSPGRKKKFRRLTELENQQEMEIEDVSENEKQQPLKYSRGEKQTDSSSDSEELDRFVRKVAPGYRKLNDSTENLENDSDSDSVESVRKEALVTIDEEVPGCSGLKHLTKNLQKEKQPPLPTANLKQSQRKKSVDSSNDSEELESTLRKEEAPRCSRVEYSSENLGHENQEVVENLKAIPGGIGVESPNESVCSRFSVGCYPEYAQDEEFVIEDTPIHGSPALNPEERSRDSVLDQPGEKNFSKKKRINPSFKTNGVNEHPKQLQDEDEEQLPLGVKMFKDFLSKKKDDSSSDSKSLRTSVRKNVHKKITESEHPKQLQDEAAIINKEQIPLGLKMFKDFVSRKIANSPESSVGKKKQAPEIKQAKGLPEIIIVDSSSESDSDLFPEKCPPDEVDNVPISGSQANQPENLDQEAPVNSSPGHSVEPSQFNPPDQDVLGQQCEIIIDVVMDESQDPNQHGFSPFVKTHGKYARCEEMESIASSEYTTADDGMSQISLEEVEKRDPVVEMDDKEEENNVTICQKPITVKIEPGLETSPVFTDYNFRSNVGETSTAGPSQTIKREIKSEFPRSKQLKRRRRIADSSNNEGVSLQWQDEPARVISAPPEMTKKTVKPRKKWMKNEDTLLLEGVDRFGEGNWKGILTSYSFGNRTAMQLKDRYRVLKKH